MGSPKRPTRPVSPRLLDQLARTLRAIEGARRAGSGPDREEDAASAMSDLETLQSLVEGSPDGSLPEGLDERLDEAGRSLEAGSIEDARETLVGVGRAIDEHLRG